VGGAGHAAAIIFLMPTELPIACSLPASELPDRLAAMTEVGRTSLRSVSSEPNRAELRFDSEAREQVVALVDAERQCCGFMEFSLEERDDEVMLRIEAPEGAEPVLEGLVSAFSRTA
jgi:hypothetical protein